jgi:hypothetical protein
MQVRQRKQAICNSQRSWIVNKPTVWMGEPGHGKVHFLNAGDTTLQDPRRFDAKEAEHKAAMAELVEKPIKYIVRRKKDQEIVGEFDTLGEAEGVISKAKAAKKASLELA